MKLKPVLTEKTTSMAKAGQYTFWVPAGATKFQIKEFVNNAFGVHVVTIKTQNKAGRTKTTLAKKKVRISARKKAIVTLRDKETIALFETEKKGKKKK